MDAVAPKVGLLGADEPPNEKVVLPAELDGAALLVPPKENELAGAAPVVGDPKPNPAVVFPRKQCQN
ncbi:hypothetical protein EON64_19630 [archaeon]|nr:MAG: hypothetical protein EON64_19630 [archaeon]